MSLILLANHRYPTLLFSPFAVRLFLMIVAVARAEFHLPAARSLKDKRRFLKSVVDRFHNRLRISIAETAFHDVHQRTEIGLAFVSADPRHAETKLDEIRRMLEGRSEAHLLAWDADCIEFLP